MEISPNKVMAHGAIWIVISIVLSAFGAHALKNNLGATDYQLDIFKTGAAYQLYHGFAILIMGLVIKQFNINIKVILNLFVLGIILFSGSLYVLCFASIYGKSIGAFGAITPIGGLCFILGWVVFIYRIYNVKK